MNKFFITILLIIFFSLFGRDVEDITKNELINKIKTWKNISKIPLIIAIDEEGWKVSRLSNNKNIVENPFLSSQDLYKQVDLIEFIKILFLKINY